VHRAIAIAGYAFVVVGLVGLIVWTKLYVVWIFMIGFGVAALPRAFAEWQRQKRDWGRPLSRPVQRPTRIANDACGQRQHLPLLVAAKIVTRMMNAVRGQEVCVVL
jgi:hypothetical protein